MRKIYYAKADCSKRTTSYFTLLVGVLLSFGSITIFEKLNQIECIGPVWQGSGSSENGSGSGSSEGAAPLEELKPFWKTFGKTAPSH